MPQNTLTADAVVSQFSKLLVNTAPAFGQSSPPPDPIREKLKKEAAQHGIRLLDPRYSIWDQVT